jgi:hypothetical protein
MLRMLAAGWAFPQKLYQKCTYLRQIKGKHATRRHHATHPPSFTKRKKSMSHDDDETGPVPLVQQLLDNPFLLLFLGVLIPMVVYTLWGVIDILTIPLAK